MEALRAAFAAARRERICWPRRKAPNYVGLLSAEEMGRALDQMAHALPVVLDYMKRLKRREGGVSALAVGVDAGILDHSFCGHLS